VALPLLPFAWLLSAGAALAQNANPVQEPAAPTGGPPPWEVLMQPPESPVQHAIENLHNFVLVIILCICVLVAVLLAVVLTRFNAKRHPTPSRTAHNTPLEVAWTLIPALILVVIAIPSFKLVFYEDHTTHADLTVKVTGHQWYWEYTYPDNGNIDFNSYIVPDDQLKPGELRLLDVDNPLVVPVGKKIRILTTSADVIHSFFIPSLGVQRYAIPGRTIETWMEVDKPGVYYGECNQICGKNHSFMPIAVHALAPAEFDAWLKQAKTKFAASPPVQPLSFAAAAPSFGAAQPAGDARGA
jgi:cytochrome c oxidase subunit 2